MFVYSVGFAVAIAIVIAICEMFNDDPKPVAVGVSSGIINFIVNMVVIYVVLPPFTYWLTGGYVLLFFVDLTIAVVISTMLSDLGMGSIAGIVGEVVMALVALVLAWGTTTPAFCDNDGYQQLAGLIQVNTATAPYPETSLDTLIRVSPQTAILKAQRAIGGNSNLGAYLAPNEANLQLVDGHWYFIVDLKVTDWLAFKNRGEVVPGYIVVDAQDAQAEAQLRTGYSLTYVPDGRFGNDLDRHFYMNFLDTSGLLSDGALASLEVDDNWYPYYSGTLLRHEVGWRGKVVDSVAILDPQTGEIVHYQLDEVPDWVDRIWSQSLVETYASWWGSYHDHAVCQFAGAAGQRSVDRINDVVTSEGMTFQVTMTSVGADQSLTEIIYFNPTTSVATVYNISGATVQAVDDLVDEATREITAEGYEPVECELHVIANEQVWYCILNGRGGGSSESSGSNAGVAFVRASATTDNTKVIIDERLDGAYRTLLEQISVDHADDPTLGESREQLQISGTVTDKRYHTFDNGESYYYFIVVTNSSGESVYLRSEASLLEATFTDIGSNVVVTYYEVPGDDWKSIIDITILGDPIFGEN